MRTALGLLVLLAGIPIGLAAQVVHVDTAFTPAAYEDGRLMATLYLPAAPNGAAVVVVHELGGTRQDVALWCDTLAARGFTAMAIEYPDPVNGSAVYPRPPRAFKFAVQFLRRNAASFHVDPGRIGALGRSLGSAVISEAITWDEDSSFFRTDPAVSDRVRAAALLYGIYDSDHFTASVLPIAQFVQQYFQSDPGMHNKGNVILHCAAIEAPLLLVHGTADEVLQYQQSTVFHDSLDAHGKPNTLLLYPNQPHVFETTTGSGAFTDVGLQVKDSVLAFFGATLLGGDGVAEVGVPDGMVLQLEQNQPNPVSGTTRIAFDIDRAGPAMLEVTDAMGRAVAPIMRTELSAGRHAVTFDASRLPCGLYGYRLVSAGRSMTRRMLVVR